MTQPNRQRRTGRRWLAGLSVAILGSGVLMAGAVAAAPTKEPPLTVRPSLLKAAYHCKGTVKGSKTEPVMFVTGTGISGDEAYSIGKGAFKHFGHPVCYLNYPDDTTADVQVSVQYLVYGIRREARTYGGKIAVFGISQGGLLPRVALTYWPDLRSKVSDVLAAAGTQHGTTVSSHCSARKPCPPAFWQQAAGSHFLTALNREPIEAPGPTAWTTVRSRTDEVVQPQTGKHPTSALRGASNIMIQRVCPGRKVSHIGTALDSVTFAAFVDAIDHRGPAKVSRLPKNVCSHRYAPGLDQKSTKAILSGSGSLIASQEASEPKVKREPKVRSYLRHIKPGR